MGLENGYVLQGRYRVVSELGQGGMGAVYRAWDTRLNIPVAVKEMRPQPGLSAEMLADLRTQFHQEAVVLARLSHPHLVRVTDFFEDAGNVYLVMEFVEGENLAARIAREGALPEWQVLTWTRELLDALGYCHKQGIIHRDVKPQNVIIRPDGQAVLVDFGLVKLWDPRDPKTKTAMRGMGTPEYAPPEQYDVSAGHTDARSDVYGLGATVYHALTGSTPPTATMRIVNPQTMQPVSWLIPGVSSATERVVARAMELQPAARFQSAAEMRAALRDRPMPPAQPARPVVAPVSQGTKVMPEAAAAAAAMAEAVPQRKGIPKWVWLVGAGGIFLALVVCGLIVGGGAWIFNLPTATPRPLVEVPDTPTPVSDVPATVVQAGSLVYEQTVYGSLNLNEEAHWTFYGNAGDTLNISLEETDGTMDTYVQLFGPNGDYLAVDDDTGDNYNALIQLFRLPESGTYTVVTRGFAYQSGSYALTVSWAAAAEEGGPIAYGEAVTAVLADGDVHYWTFDGTSGDRVTISMEQIDGMDTYLELYGPDSAQLTTDDDSGDGLNSLIQNFQLPASGTYTIVARGYSNQAGSYALSLQLSAGGSSGGGSSSSSGGGWIEYDQTIESTLAQGEQHTWYFVGNVGDIVTISMDETDGTMDTYLELYGPTGLALTTDDDGGPGLNARIRYYVLPSNGTYTIVARGLSLQAGSYALSLVYTDDLAVGGGQITYGQSVEGTLDVDGENRWNFQGTAGDVVTIAMDETDGMDTYLELYSFTGERLARDDDSGDGLNALIADFRLPDTGTYTIIARSYSYNGGSYRLTLSR